MTAEIVWEGSTLCRTLWWGMVFAAEYDTIRIFRRIVKHNMLVIMVLEDMAYWIYVSIKIFSICFYVNDGVIRAFIIAGFIMGAGLYVKALSRYYIKYGVKLISFFIKIATGKTIKDTTSGMRAYDQKAINEFIRNTSLTPEPDTLVYMLKKGLKIKEVQVEMKDREFGTSYLTPIKSMKYMVNMIFSIVFIRAITRKNK